MLLSVALLHHLREEWRPNNSPNNVESARTVSVYNFEDNVLAPLPVSVHFCRFGV